MKILRFISKIVKFILREICSFAIKLGLIFVILLFVLTIFLKSQKKEIIKSAYLKIDLSKEYTDPATVIPFNLDAGDINFYTLMTKINMAKVDKEIKGLVLFLDGNSLSRTKVTELIEVLKDFKASNKPIYSYATMLNNNSLLLSSISTEFYMPPSATTTVNITGYYKSLPYYKELADKIGVDFNVIHVGDFKTFGENYVRKEISNENRADLTRILDKSFDIYTDEYSTNANVSETRIRNLIITGELMGVSSLALKDSHLIKNLDYWENVKKDKKIDKIYDIAEYHNLNMVQQKDKIAVVYAVGDIESSLSKEPKFLSITSSKLIEALKKAEKASDVKGIVLRVNSPGGSALESNIIYNYIKNMKKPVYVSIGDVSASGGYYISVAGKKIFANSASITGSIGVVSLIPNFEKLSKKIGVNFNELSLGKYADLYSLTTEMDESRRQRIYDTSLKVYDEFKRIVSENRNIPIEKVENIAQGKIWLGEEAKEIGLIDEIGSLNDTIFTLAKDLKLEKYSIVEVPIQKSLSSYVRTMLFSTRLQFLSVLFMEDKKLEKIVDKELFFKPTLYLSYFN